MKTPGLYIHINNYVTLSIPGSISRFTQAPWYHLISTENGVKSKTKPNQTHHSLPDEDDDVYEGIDRHKHRDHHRGLVGELAARDRVTLGNQNQHEQEHQRAQGFERSTCRME